MGDASDVLYGDGDDVETCRCTCSSCVGRRLGKGDLEVEELQLRVAHLSATVRKLNAEAQILELQAKEMARSKLKKLTTGTLEVPETLLTGAGLE